MKVSLVDVDGHNFPNFALMKIAAWHKQQGDLVDWYEPLFSHPERIYASKVFTFTSDFDSYANCDPEPIKGGTGYDYSVKLPDEIEQTLPDYSIYPEFTSALGFLTRGCIRNCPWCIVPKKEGTLKVVDDIARIAQNRKNVILLDNNFLASPEEFVKEQLEKASALGLRIDFNQALDCRLVNEQNAPLLAETKWIQYIRFSCDTSSCLPHIEHAVRLIRKFGYNGHFFVYALAKEFDEAHERILKLLDIDDRIDPFCQPYIDYSGGTADKKLKKLARWCNRPALRKTTTWNDYKWQ